MWSRRTILILVAVSVAVLIVTGVVLIILWQTTDIFSTSSSSSDTNRVTASSNSNAAPENDSVKTEQQAEPISNSNWIEVLPHQPEAKLLSSDDLQEFTNTVIQGPEEGILEDFEQQFDALWSEEEQQNKDQKQYIDELTESLETFIPRLFYINLDRCPDRKALIENQISSLKLRGRYSSIKRLRAFPRDNGALGCYLSHVVCLAHALSDPTKPVLILEDDFEFQVSPAALLHAFQRIDQVTEKRWDVIVLGPYVHEWQVCSDVDEQPAGLSMSQTVCRLLKSTTTSGYLVNGHYISIMLKFLCEKLRYNLKNKVTGPSFHIDQVQVELQKTGWWYTTAASLGGQRSGLSIIGQVQANNTWEADSDLKSYRDGSGKSHPIRLIPSPAQRLRIAICHIATNKYNQYVGDIHEQFFHHFLNNHHLEFFLFTNKPELYANAAKVPSHQLAQTKQGAILHVVTIPGYTFPDATLYRYRLMDSMKNLLSSFDYIFYSDVDYHIVRRVHDSDILLPPGQTGLIATEHLHNITEARNKNHIGSPDVNPESKAYIAPHEYMKAYYAGGVQGGTSQAFLKACFEMDTNIRIDEENKVMAKWHDESHWNRYLVDHPPARSLNQSFIYKESCLYGDVSSICLALQERSIEPIMVPLDKNHAEVRSVVPEKEKI